MIINYGAFVSPTLDKNYLPVTLKYLELYTLTYGLDDILAELSKATNKTFHKSGKTANSGKYSIRMESEDGAITEIDSIKVVGGETLFEASPVRKGNSRPTTSPYENTGNAVTVQTAPRQGRPITSSPNTRAPENKKNPKVDTGKLDRGIISVEPTYVTVNYDDQIFIFGVKVLPVYIRNENTIIRDMLNDSKNSILKVLQKGLFRTFQRIGNKIYSNTVGKLPLLGANPPSEIKVKKQIILGTSTLKNNVYIVLNKNNIDQAFINDSKSISDMHKYLGWCSMVFADDVNQQATFCMKVNHGMCNLVPYRVLMASTGSKGIPVAYDSIDEIQNAVTSVFKIQKQNFSKIFAEMKVASKLLDIQQYLTESFLQENTQNYLKNPDLAIDMFKKIRFISKNSDIDFVRKKMEGFPFETLDTMNKYIFKINNDFKKPYKFFNTVIKNSIDISDNDLTEEDLKIATTILAFRSSNMRGQRQTQRTMEIVKEFVIIYRKNSRQLENKKLALFRTMVDVFNSNTSILRYNDLSDDKERQNIILQNMYVFLSLVPLLIIEN